MEIKLAEILITNSFAAGLFGFAGLVVFNLFFLGTILAKKLING
jgi:hypothetical protein